MQADVKMGDMNICVGCGQLRITMDLDEDGLPLCSQCQPLMRTWRVADDRSDTEVA